MNEAREIGVAILGLGTVGTSVLKVLSARGEELAERYGVRFNVRWGLVRDLDKERDPAVPRDMLTTSMDDILGDPEVKMVVEVMGGVDPTFDLVLRSLATKRPVVTANKHLLAVKGPELEFAALENGVALRYDASVGGIIPVFSTLGGGIHAFQVTRIRGILNGTSNYILSSMYNNDLDYEEALMEAQEKGYAEPDPTMDVSGMDIAHKLCVLSRLVFGRFLPLEEVDVEGIGPGMAMAVPGAKHRGMKIKLVGTLSMEGSKAGQLPRAMVRPEEVGQEDPVYRFDGTSNCIVFDTMDTGEILICGRGAGGPETATAIVTDLLSIAKGID